MANVSPLSVIGELQELVDEITVNIPEVPGKNRLIKACVKEIAAFQRLPEDISARAVTCSNLPHLKAITRLALAYGERLVGLLCRYRMRSDASEVDSEDVSASDSRLQTLHNHGPSFPSRNKPGVLHIDLVCNQRQSDTKPQCHEKKRATSLPGNAMDAALWFPSLWIKVVTRDADRLNSAWRGDVSQHSACLYRQLSEMVTTAASFQSGQPPNWIRVLLHWVPPIKESTPLETLDLDLLNQLNTLLTARILTNYEPWQDSFPTDYDVPAVVGAVEYDAHFSLTEHMCPSGFLDNLVHDFISSTAPPDDFALREAAVKTIMGRIDAAIRDELEQEIQLKEAVEREEDAIYTPLDAVLSQSKVIPFESTTLQNLDSLPRVNLDVSALIAMVSELSQFMPFATTEICGTNAILQTLASDEQRALELRNQPRFTCATLDWLLESEAERAVMLTLGEYIKGSVVIVCRTAVITFLNILATIASLAEWHRGIQLLTRLVIVPDLALDNSRSKLSTEGTVKENRRRTQGLKPTALLLPARALTGGARRIHSSRLTQS